MKHQDTIKNSGANIKKWIQNVVKRVIFRVAVSYVSSKLFRPDVIAFRTLKNNVIPRVKSGQRREFYLEFVCHSFTAELEKRPINC